MLVILRRWRGFSIYRSAQSVSRRRRQPIGISRLEYVSETTQPDTLFKNEQFWLNRQGEFCLQNVTETTIDYSALPFSALLLNTKGLFGVRL